MKTKFILNAIAIIFYFANNNIIAMKKSNNAKNTGSVKFKLPGQLNVKIELIAILNTDDILE